MYPPVLRRAQKAAQKRPCHRSRSVRIGFYPPPETPKLLYDQ